MLEDVEVLIANEKFDKLFAYSLDCMFNKCIYLEPFEILHKILNVLPANEVLKVAKCKQYLGLCQIILNRTKSGIELLEQSLQVSSQNLPEFLSLHIENLRILSENYYETQQQTKLHDIHLQLNEIYEMYIDGMAENEIFNTEILIDYSLALFHLLNRSSRDSVRAEELMRKIISKMSLATSRKITMIYRLIEILMTEWKIYQKPEVYDEILDLLNKGEVIINSISRAMCIYRSQEINFRIIRAKILVITGQYAIAYDDLESVRILASKYNFGEKQLLIQTELSNLQQEFNEIKIMVESNSSLAELVDKVAINNYMKLASDWASNRSR